MTEHLMQWVLDNLAFNDFKSRCNFKPTDYFFDVGFIDSMFLYNLYKHLDEEYGVKVPLEDIGREELCTVTKIVDYISRQFVYAQDTQRQCTTCSCTKE